MNFLNLLLADHCSVSGHKPECMVHENRKQCAPTKAWSMKEVCQTYTVHNVESPVVHFVDRQQAKGAGMINT